MAHHSIYNSNYTGRIACGLPILPFKTKFDGPGNSSFQMRNQMDIIDEAFHYFRVNILFKNFQLQGPADKLIVYLSVLLSHLFKLAQNIKDEPNARKRLGEVVSAQVPPPKDKGNFMSIMLEDGNFNERQQYSQYLKHIKAETINRFIERFFGDGVVNDDFKFWAGLGKKKFMGMNFASLF